MKEDQENHLKTKMNKRKIGGLGLMTLDPLQLNSVICSCGEVPFSPISLSIARVLVQKAIKICFFMPSAKRQRMSSVVWSLEAVNASGVGLITVSTRQRYRPNVDNIEKKRTYGYLDFSLPRMIFV